MEHLTKSQFATMAGLSPARISQLIKDGKLKTVTIYGTEVIPLTPENLKTVKL